MADLHHEMALEERHPMRCIPPTLDYLLHFRHSGKGLAADEEEEEGGGPVVSSSENTTC